MTSWVKVGAECALITDTSLRKYAHRYRKGEIFPVMGVTYTIREIVTNSNGTLCIRLNEIINPVLSYIEATGEIMFQSKNFRPIIRKTKEQDIALFKSLVKENKISLGA